MKYTVQAVYGEKIPFTTAENLDYLLKFLKPQTLHIKFIKIFFTTYTASKPEVNIRLKS